MDKKEIYIFLSFVLGLAIVAAVFLIYVADFNFGLGRGESSENAAQSAPAEEKLAEEALVRGISDFDHHLGSKDAPVQLIVYGNFGCPFCASLDSSLKEARGYFGEKITVAFRHFLTEVNGVAFKAALASECANEQGNFFGLADRLFAAESRNMLDDNQIKAEAIALGLNGDQFMECLGGEKYKEKIFSEVEEAGKYGVIGTPTFFVNSKIYAGAYPFNDFVDSTGETRPGLKSIISQEL